MRKILKRATKKRIKMERSLSGAKCNYFILSKCIAKSKTYENGRLTVGFRGFGGAVF